MVLVVQSILDVIAKKELNVSWQAAAACTVIVLKRSTGDMLLVAGMTTPKPATLPSVPGATSVPKGKIYIHQEYFLWFSIESPYLECPVVWR